MKKTISIHIANFIFNIEEDAYFSLQNYLNAISDQFSNLAEREEIMQDIEFRIAELFKEKLTTVKEVITTLDVTDMISIMGQPEVYAIEEEEQPEAEKKSAKPDNETKQIYRDDEHAILGGVCSGLGAYFGIDPIIIRIIFIVVTLMGGSGILIYLILYFAIPEAKTIAEKLKMKGQKIDLTSIKSQFEKVKNEINVEENSSKVKALFNRFIQVVVQLFSKFIHFFSKVIGLVTLLVGVLGIILVVLFFNPSLLSLITEKSFSIYEVAKIIFVSSTHQNIVYYSLILAIILPMGYFLSLGIQLLFKVKNNFKPLKIVLLTTWLFSVFVLFLAGSFIARNFNFQSPKLSEHKSFTLSNEEILKVDVNNSTLSSVLLDSKETVELYKPIQLTDEATYFQFPELMIKPSVTDSFSIEVLRRSKGVKESEAIELAKEIDYKYILNDNNILLSSFLSFPATSKFRGQQVRIVISVPQDRKLTFGNNIEAISTSLQTKRNYVLNNTTWVNRKGRIVKVASKKSEAFN